MKKALIIIVIAVVAVIGFWLLQDEPEPLPVSVPAEEEPLTPDEAPEDLVPDEPAPPPAEDDALLDDPATDEPSLVDQAIQDADEAAEAAESTIAEILEAQEEAAAEAEAAAQAAIDQAMAAGDEAAAEADAAVSEAERSIRQQMDATDTQPDSMLATDDAPEPEIVAADQEGLFTPEGFDFDRAMQAIESADLDPINASAARALLESVRNDPDALDAALNQLRNMLGL